jgi:RNA polymerase sigma factor (sigma-70 family)
VFPTTRHSAIAAGPAGFPLIVEAYWKPVYLYLRLQHRRSAADAADLTQELFARAWEGETFRSFDPAKGRFRTFLRTLVDRLALNAHEAATRLKRGGGAEHVSFDFAAAEHEVAHPRSAADPEELFARELVRALLQQALEELRAVNAQRFAVFEAYELADDGASYADLAARFGAPVSTITNWLAAARRDLRRFALQRLRAITATEEEFRAEARRIFGS